MYCPLVNSYFYIINVAFKKFKYQNMPKVSKNIFLWILGFHYQLLIYQSWIGWEEKEDSCAVLVTTNTNFLLFPQQTMWPSNFKDPLTTIFKIYLNVTTVNHFSFQWIKYLSDYIVFWDPIVQLFSILKL